ncbi:hypothetical protein HPP92_027879 [Vanilla planifolia]|uniref:Uncharacterized protein n=1 Tax=Vanilla planifolia TaxID=51239 RepID=A0A835U3N0_VANPL|nr:hypothetical protein HPP92_027879 [Vanilla planifolia]
MSTKEIMLPMRFGEAELVELGSRSRSSHREEAIMDQRLKLKRLVEVVKEKNRRHLGKDVLQVNLSDVATMLELGYKVGHVGER